jgi:hypothetical protein
MFVCVYACLCFCWGFRVCVCVVWGFGFVLMDGFVCVLFVCVCFFVFWLGFSVCGLGIFALTDERSQVVGRLGWFVVCGMLLCWNISHKYIYTHTHMHTYTHHVLQRHPLRFGQGDEDEARHEDAEAAEEKEGAPEIEGRGLDHLCWFF